MVLSKEEKEIARKLRITEEDYKEYKRLNALISKNQFIEYEEVRSRLIPIMKDAIAVALGQIPVVLQKFHDVSLADRALVQAWAFNVAVAILADIGVTEEQLVRKWGNTL